MNLSVSNETLKFCFYVKLCLHLKKQQQPTSNIKTGM